MRGRHVSWIMVAAVLLAAPALADKFSGPGRVLRMNGQVLEGDVTETDDGYQVKTDFGITVTLRRSEVLKVLPLEKKAAAGGPTPVAVDLSAGGRSGLPAVSDKEIEEILGSATVYESLREIAELDEDPMAELPLNEASLAEMKRIAGSDDTILRPHFVFVYSGDKEPALKLAARLEQVYEWNIRFMQMTGVPIRRPEYKLEIFFYGTLDEFMAYGTTVGFDASSALGFYMRTNNRSAFYNQEYSPEVAHWRAELEAEGTDWRRKQYLRNKIATRQEWTTLKTVQHEAAHHIHFNIGLFPKRGDVPQWLVEGMATMFELPPGTGGGSLGAINHFRLWYYRRLFGREGQGLPDMREFLASNNLWQGFPSYSIGWALCNYLWREHRPEFAQYMQRIAQRNPDEPVRMSERMQEFEEIFGKVDEEWVKRFKDYTANLHLKKSAIMEDDRE